jgi:Domain of unknown function DUF83.
MQIKQLSNSSMDRFNACPLSFFHRYLNPERPAQKDTVEFYAQYGSLMHFFAEFYPRSNFYRDMEFDIKAEKEEDSSLTSYLNSYGNQIMEEGVSLDLQKMLAIYDTLFPLIQFPDADKRDVYYNQGVDFITRLPHMEWSKVIGIEQYFKIDLCVSGLPPIIGFIDKVERDEKGIIVTDYKTSKPYSPAATMKKNQLPLYGMACWFLYGELPYKYRYHFTRFNKVVEVEIPLERLSHVKQYIQFTYMKMAGCVKEEKFPAQFNSFYCNSFCGFQRLCPTFQAYNE